MPSGFTLIEMLVVLVILALATGLMLARTTRHGPRLETRGAATMVLQALREARSDAIGNDQDVSFTVDPAHARFRIGAQVPRRLPGAVTIALDQGGKPARTIDFAADGSSAGGRVVVAENGMRIAVSVDWLTGRISTAALP